MNEPANMAFLPLTPNRWPDLEALFGPRGACAGCWCMYWRLPARAYDAGKGEPNRLAMRSLVMAGAEPGVIAYVDGRPAGWCATAPRIEYLRLERSRILAPPDEAPVWSAVCFFIAKPFRGRGLSVPLLQATVEHARSRAAEIVEGYPLDLRAGRTADAFAYHGLASTFRRAGFVEVTRRSPTRPIMRIQFSHRANHSTEPGATLPPAL